MDNPFNLTDRAIIAATHVLINAPGGCKIVDTAVVREAVTAALREQHGPDAYDYAELEDPCDSMT